MKKISQLTERSDFKQNPIRAILKRLWWRLRWRITSKPWLIHVQDGYSIWLTHSGSCALIYYLGCSERQTKNFITGYLKDGMVFVDIGAHVGEFSKVAASIVGSSGQVHAFEPNPFVYKVLEKNRDNNQFQNITINCTAVASTDGNLSFCIQNDPSMSSIIAQGQQVGNAISVRALRLDTYAQRIVSKIDLIKMDVEGAELQVFKGATELLKLPPQQAPTWLFEYLKQNYAQFGYKLLDVVSFLTGYGYTVMKMGQGEGEIFATEVSVNDIPIDGSNLVATKTPGRFQRK